MFRICSTLTTSCIPDRLELLEMLLFKDLSDRFTSPCAVIRNIPGLTIPEIGYVKIIVGLTWSL